MADALNQQVFMEAQSSQACLALGSGPKFSPGSKASPGSFFKHSDEERRHMLKLIHFINERAFALLLPCSNRRSPLFR